ncbi:MAG: hypothetical protein JWN38_1272 [Candidatus Saccharibacteria bacterium]|nr:hypothetical protein [Candidatus Saccharibacteria bacterium]
MPQGVRENILDLGKAVVLNAPQLFIDVDVEADGIAGHGSMLSIGAQSPTGESFYSEIKPYSEDFLPGNREFCENHGLQRERLLREAPELSVVMFGLHNWTTELRARHGKRAVLTAFNAGFDWAHVDLGFVKAGFIENNPFGVAPFDLKSLATQLNGNWDWSKTRKSQLPRAIVPDGDFTHHALEDAQYQQKIHFGMAGLLGQSAYLGIAQRV